MLVSPGSTSVHILRSREGKSRHWGWPQDSSGCSYQLPQRTEQCPSCLGRERGLRQQREVVSSVCWVSLCQASPVRTRRPQIFQAPVSQRGHLVRVLSRSPQTHQATRNPKAPGKTGPGSRVPKRLGCGTQGSARLFLLPDPTSRVRTECDLQTEGSRKTELPPPAGREQAASSARPPASPPASQPVPPAVAPPLSSQAPKAWTSRRAVGGQGFLWGWRVGNLGCT